MMTHRTTRPNDGIELVADDTYRHVIRCRAARWRFGLPSDMSTARCTPTSRWAVRRALIRVRHCHSQLDQDRGLMADKSPRRHQSKKSGKTMKEKRTDKKAKQVAKRAAK